MPPQVQDKKAELTLNLSVLVQTLLLASTIGFGSTLVDAVKTLTKEVAKINTINALHGKDISYNTKAIVKNKEEAEKRSKENSDKIEQNKIAINNINKRKD